ncbi:AAA family ATPase [Dactylosporangium vinaceum]|uniref:AAA family ATPase n=1 Tax=Dactylosporangium vinaceum TaxID=53362 RepID=A0ABV5MP59_9ACTN|nr:AAA family ATPase [Dactylosporangium vinaceum]
MTVSRQVFVGRDAELAQLESSLVDAAERRPATVMLGGEAGVGKSRLLQQFVAAARGERHGAFVLIGRCMDLAGGTVPYAPLVDALRRARAEGADGLSLGGSAYTALSGLIADFTGEQPAAGATAPGGSQLQVFGAVMRLLEQVGEQAPVVLIFEDVHWADPSTLDLVAFLTQAKSAERLLLVCSHRTNDRHGDGRLAALLAEPQFALGITPIELGRFSREELRDFLAEAGPGAPSRRDVDQVFQLSQGNPLFAAELLRTGAAAAAGGASVPERLRAIVLSRYQELSADGQQLMRVAAAAGQRIGGSLLMATSGLPPARLLEALRECVDGHALVVDRADGSYVFWHALLREAVYEDRILPLERSLLHARMAEAISEDGELGQVTGLSAKAALAYHWFQAGRKREALAAAIQAAEAAVDGRTYPEALLLYRRAVELWPAVPERDRPAGAGWTRLLTEAADAARWAGEVAYAVTLIERAIEATPSAELWERLGSYRWEAGDYPGSAEAYEQAAALMDGRPGGTTMARVRNGQAIAALQGDRYTEALALADEAQAMAAEAGNRGAQSRALGIAGLALALLARPDEGVQRLRESIRIAQSIEHLEHLFRGYANLGVALEIAGRLRESVDVAIEGRNHARRLRLDRARQGAVLANNAAATLVLLGRWDEALGIIAEELPDRPVTETRFLRLTLADVQVARGEFEAARAALAEVQGPASPRFGGLRAVCAAELAYWDGRPAADVLGAVEDGFTALGGAANENTTVALQLCAAALRAWADESDARVRPGDRASREPAREQADELLRRAEAAAKPQARKLPEIRALIAWCEAERDRAAGAATPETWAAVAELWDAAERPYPAAYARFRAALTAWPKDRPAVRRHARAAAQTADELRARPLAARLEGLARLANFELRPAGDAPEAAAAPANPLTPRQREVLLLIEQRRLSDREIAEELHIAVKTVSRHLGDAGTVLDVKGRHVIAKIARQRGYLD